MKHLAHILFPFFWKLGGPGLLILGVLDSSFLFAPLGNDLLVVAMSARYHSLMRALYYAGMSTVGSVLGCLLVDVIFRKAGEKGLARHLPKARVEYVKKRIEKNAAWALVLASIAPPPFPFTPFIMAAAALQYPRQAHARDHRSRAHGSLHCAGSAGAALRPPHSALGGERCGAGNPDWADDPVHRGQRDFGGRLDQAQPRWEHARRPARARTSALSAWMNAGESFSPGIMR